MGRRTRMWIGLCSAAVLGAADGVDAAVQVVDDTRFARTMGSTSEQLLLYYQTEHAGFGQDFDATAVHAGAYGWAESQQQWSLDVQESGAFELEMSLWVRSYLDDAQPAVPETHYADVLMDVTLANDVPIAYEAMVELSTQGQSHMYFRGLPLSEVDGAGGVRTGQGVLEPGEHRLRSWGYASTMSEGLFDPEQLLDPAVLVEGGQAYAQVTIRGQVKAHVVPAPAAVGPGLVLLGMLLMRRAGRMGSRVSRSGGPGGCAGPGRRARAGRCARAC